VVCCGIEHSIIINEPMCVLTISLTTIIIVRIGGKNGYYLPKLYY